MICARQHTGIVFGVLTILLTRHGHTDRSVPEHYLGRRIQRPSRSAAGAMPGRSRERLKSVPIDRVISSPLESRALRPHG